MPLSDEILSFAELEAFDDGGPTNGGERRFCCPLRACSDKPVDSSHRSISMNLGDGSWICFRCKAHGLLREYWRRPPDEGLANTSFQSRKPARTEATASMLTLEKDEMERDGDRDYTWYERLKSKQIIDGTPAAAYLEGRGISLETAKQAGVRYIADLNYRPAVLFPIWDGQGRFIAAHARFLDGGTPRMLTYGQRKQGLFLTRVDALDADTIAICEAPIDGLSCQEAGVSAVAICGVGDGPLWLSERLAWKNAIIAFDADEAGEKAAASLARSLGVFGARVFRYVPYLEGGPECKDCNDVLLRGSVDILAAGLRPTSGAVEVPTVKEEEIVMCSECNWKLAQFPEDAPTKCESCWSLKDLDLELHIDWDEVEGKDRGAE